LATSSEFYTFDETLRILGISEKKLKNAVSHGEIRGYRQGDALVFKKTEILSLRQEGKEVGLDDGPRTVHALWAGQPMREFTRDVPRDWPFSHTWTYHADVEHITCEPCKKKAEEKLSVETAKRSS